MRRHGQVVGGLVIKRGHQALAGGQGIHRQKMRSNRGSAGLISGAGRRITQA